MRKLFALATLALTLLTFTGSAAQVPRKASELAIMMPGGQPQLLLSNYKGKVVVMAMMYTTCPHCQKTAQLLSKIQPEFAGKPVQFLGVTFDRDAAANVQQFIKFFGVTFPTGYSNEAIVRPFMGLKDNEPYFVPMLVFIDKTGMIRSQFIGEDNYTDGKPFLENQDVNVRKEINRLLSLGAPAAAPAAGAKTATKTGSN